MRTQHQLRDATPTDRDAIVAIDHLAHERVDFIERALQSRNCLVAERDGQVVAYGVLEYTFFEQGFVSMLYVAEAERRHGIGRSLMEALAARCKTRKLFTSTNESNGPMQALLKTMGYIPSGIIENLDPGDPEVVYFHDLGQRTV
jgi:ribosomal protein S18 acetylase RimI-like enzyme